MSKALHFEKAMTELEDIVKQLEKGDLSLDDCLKQYEKGMTLARKCQDTLTQAEQKVEILRINHTAMPEASDE